MTAPRGQAREELGGAPRVVVATLAMLCDCGHWRAAHGGGACLHCGCARFRAVAAWRRRVMAALVAGR